MRAALGLIPATGRIEPRGAPCRRRAPRAAAFMPQDREIAWPVTVETLVALGRVPWLPARGAPAARCRRRRAAPSRASTSGRSRGRTVTRLSGGEQARALLARTLAQETPLLLADEPIAGFDPAHDSR